MKQLWVIFACVVSIIIFSAEVKCEESSVKHTSCDYTGIIKEMSNKGDVLTVETDQKGTVEFDYKYEGKKGCSSWEELAKNDRVQVTCEEKKNRLVAVCVQKNPKQYVPWVMP